MRLLFAMLSVMLAFALGVFAEHDFNVVSVARSQCVATDVPVKCRCRGNCTCCDACPGKGGKGPCTCSKCDCCLDCPGHYKQKQK